MTGVWAGLRPLLADDEDHHHSERTADLSRRHRVRTAEDGVVHVTGGKWTTYRLMAEHTVDEVGPPAPRHAAVPHEVAPAHRRAVEHRAHRRCPGIDPALARHLASRYGTEAAAVVGVAAQDASLLEPFCEPLPYVGAELVFAARQRARRDPERPALPTHPRAPDRRPRRVRARARARRDSSQASWAGTPRASTPRSPSTGRCAPTSSTRRASWGRARSDEHAPAPDRRSRRPRARRRRGRPHRGATWPR